MKNIYQKKIDEHIEIQDRIVLDIDNWLWLDFQQKKCYYGAMDGIFDEPATVWEYIAFYRNFLLKNIKKCTFSELKQYVYFDGRRKKNRLYALIRLDDRSMYFEWLRNKRTVQRSFDFEVTNRDPRIIYYQNTVDFLKYQLQIAEKRLKSFQK